LTWHKNRVVLLPVAKPYLTSPSATEQMPSGVPYIIGNEFAERFSFYGMRAVLYAFMTKALVDHAGAPDLMSEAKASEWVHLFITAVYFTPLIGALLADLWLGKYRTIIVLSLVYCAGHLVLALDPTRDGLVLGLGLIALGAGGIKPCVSAHVGDQFGRSNAHLLPRVFNWFYFSINVGATLSMLLTPWLLEHYGPHLAFGVPGALMLLATWVFWLGRHQFAHIPAQPREFVKELVQPSFLRPLAGLLVLYGLIAAFWSVFDQTASRWIAQAEKMDREILGWEILPSQMQSLNSILVLTLIPLFTLMIYPALGKVVQLTAMRRIGAGFVVTVAAVGVSWWIESQLDAGVTLHIGWQGLAYLLLTTAEILISITALEFSYTQSPLRLKSFIMSLYLLSVALGNYFTAWINGWIEQQGSAAGLDGAAYYGFFFKLILGTTVVFLVVSRFYRETRYLQGDTSQA
jgi:proton-dependent oligopeptide transporter, POT family